MERTALAGPEEREPSGLHTHFLPDGGNSIGPEPECVGPRAVSTVLLIGTGLLLPLLTIAFSVSVSLFHQLPFSCLRSGCCAVLRRIKNRNSHASGIFPSVPSASPSEC